MSEEKKETFEEAAEQVIQNDPLLEFIEVSKWSFILHGLLAVILGICLIINPLMAIVTLTILIGIFFIIDSVLMFFDAFRCDGAFRALRIIYAILILILGILMIWRPFTMDIVWIIFVGAWQLITGISMLVGKYDFKGTGFIRFSGVLSILLGIALMVWPLIGITAVVWVAGIFLLVSGILLLVSGFSLPKKKKA